MGRTISRWGFTTLVLLAALLVASSRHATRTAPFVADSTRQMRAASGEARATRLTDATSLPSARRSTVAAARPDARALLANRPLTFEANQGQVDSSVAFISRGVGYTMFLTGNSAVLALQKAAPPAAADPQMPAQPTRQAVLTMTLADANPAPRIAGRDQLTGRANYFIGSDPSRWRTNVPTYRRVEYAGVYPGIDVTYYGNQRQLEYDFVVSPGADPSRLALAFDGADSLSIDGNGDLVLRVPGGEVRELKPIVYQEQGGIREEIDGHYVIRGDRQVGFEIGKYDAGRPLVIDPILAYSTFLGGTTGPPRSDGLPPGGGTEAAHAVAVDGSGAAYVTGQTNSADFPTTVSAVQPDLAPSFDLDTGDAFVTKFTSDGTVVYSTYIGGSLTDIGFGIAVGPDGEAVITGNTGSTPGAPAAGGLGFPVTSSGTGT